MICENVMVENQNFKRMRLRGKKVEIDAKKTIQRYEKESEPLYDSRGDCA